MPISFHGGHSGGYCDHASGTLSDLVKTVIARGFSHYGLSEHMPRFKPEQFYPEERTLQRTPEFMAQRFSDYMEEARKLQKSVQSQLKLLVGMETEVIDKDFVSDIQKLCDTHQPDYLVGSVHHVSGVPFDYGEKAYCQAEKEQGGTEALFLTYYDHQYELMQALQPKVIGHFDLIRMFRPDFPLTSAIWEVMERNIAYAIDYGALFEVNARAFKKGLDAPYPTAPILQKILTHGGKLTLGDDSHSPDQVGLNYDRLIEFLNNIGVTQIYALELGDEGVREVKVALPWRFEV